MRFWDELNCLMPIPMYMCGGSCIYDLSKNNVEMSEANRLMPFLMGLNDAYKVIRNQILVMDPILSASKTYSMLLIVKKQKEVK